MTARCIVQPAQMLPRKLSPVSILVGAKRSQGGSKPVKVNNPVE